MQSSVYHHQHCEFESSSNVLKSTLQPYLMLCIIYILLCMYKYMIWLLIITKHMSIFYFEQCVNCSGVMKVHSIQHYVLKIVNDLWQVGRFLLVLQFPPPIKLTAMIYNWNIVESGVKHHNPNPGSYISIYHMIMTTTASINVLKSTLQPYLMLCIIYILLCMYKYMIWLLIITKHMSIFYFEARYFLKH
jgi:lipopolysaccharide/colanic/teichoic acid biosynthesis glycosyltransferase